MFKFLTTWGVLASVAIVAAASTEAIAQPSAALSQKAPDVAAMSAAAALNGRVRVIVSFAPATVDTQVTSDQATLDRTKAYVKATQDAILARHFGGSAMLTPVLGFDRVLKRPAISPMFSLNVTMSELEVLAADPQVVRLDHDAPDPLNLDDTVPQIHMTQPDGGAYALGATGAGQAVAILDTGVQENHPFLAGKVIVEACFATTDPNQNSVSLCRGNAPFDEGPGSAAPCVGFEGCSHGTQVAGIAAGNNTVPGPPPGTPRNGVARDAKIISLMVFSHIGNGIGSFPTDQVLALEWLNGKADSFGVPLAAINLSLGKGHNAVACDGDPRAYVIQQLRKKNIAVVAGTANDGYVDGIAAPACISSVIAVSSVTKPDKVTKRSSVSSFSNMGSLVALLAPGGALTGGSEDVLSSVPTNQYAFAAGTSMASPHVTGAIAAIRSVRRKASIDDIVKALEKTGEPIQDRRLNGTVTRPLIRVDLAVKELIVLDVAQDADIAPAGNVGGPFHPASFTYDVTSPGGVLKFVVTKPEWLDVSSSTGRFETPTRVTFTVNAKANGKPPGIYPEFVTFTNTTNGYGTTTRRATLTVNAVVIGSLQEFTVPPQLLVPMIKGITDDGQTVLIDLCGQVCPSDYQAYRLLQAGSANLLDSIGVISGGHYSNASAMNPTGTIIVGATHFVAHQDEAFSWAQGQFAALGAVPGDSISSAVATNRDGSVIVAGSGGSSTAAFWRRDTGMMQRLPLPAGAGGANRANDISADGSTIVGVNDDYPAGSRRPMAFRWSGPNFANAQPLGKLPGDDYSRAFQISADGNVIVGVSGTLLAGKGTVFRYVVSTGSLQPLPALDTRP